MNKKSIRSEFRTNVFKRDKYCCVCCGKHGKCRQTGEGFDGIVNLDAHHITDRSLMPNGGYVKENGISLCEECHFLAELFNRTGIAHAGFSPEDLYAKIGSSFPLAFSNSLRIK